VSEEIPKEVEEACQAYGRSVHEWVIAKIPDDNDETNDPAWDARLASGNVLRSAISAALRSAREEGRRDVREPLLAMADRWHSCNEGRPPNEVENAYRKCGRELEKYVRRTILLSPTPPEKETADE
jgi:hypothetical protein